MVADDAVIFYEHPNRGGYSKENRPANGQGSWDVNYLPHINMDNDIISAIDIGKNVRLRVYDHANRQGYLTEFYGDQYYYGNSPGYADFWADGTSQRDYNDRISSFDMCIFQWNGDRGWTNKRKDAVRVKRDTAANNANLYAGERNRQNALNEEAIRQLNGDASKNITGYYTDLTNANNDITKYEQQLAQQKQSLQTNTSLYNTEVAKQKEIVAIQNEMRAKYRDGVMKAINDRAITVVELDVDKYTYLSEDDKYYIEM